MPELATQITLAALTLALLVSIFAHTRTKIDLDKSRMALSSARTETHHAQEMTRYYVKALAANRAGAHDLTTLAREIHANAQAKGWYESRDKSPRCLLELIALIHSELSEAVEEIRNGKPARYVEHGKPEGYGVELADALIRILDMMAYLEIDASAIVAEKIEYNTTRAHRHGGKLS